MPHINLANPDLSAFSDAIRAEVAVTADWPLQTLVAHVGSRFSVAMRLTAEDGILRMEAERFGVERHPTVPTTVFAEVTCDLPEGLTAASFASSVTALEDLKSETLRKLIRCGMLPLLMQGEAA